METDQFVDFVEQVRRGDLLLGVDRAIARKLFTEIPLAAIRERLGWVPRYRAILVRTLFGLAPIALLASVSLSFASSWWLGLVALIALPAFYACYWGVSSGPTGGAYAISCLTFASAAGIFLDRLAPPTLIAPTFLLSLCCVRMVYVLSASFYRDILLHDQRSYCTLSPSIGIKTADGVWLKHPS